MEESNPLHMKKDVTVGLGFPFFSKEQEIREMELVFLYLVIGSKE